MYKFVESENGPLRIFRLPEPGMVYTMGIDASTGLANDNSAIQIVTNTIPVEQVAILKVLWPVNQVSAFANSLGRFYNEALNVCEVNYPGNAVQDALLQYYRYPRNYQAETRLDEEMDISTRYGFRTTETTKWLLIVETQAGMASGEIILNDPETITEFERYVYQASKSKAGAAAGFNDDTVMAFMLAYHGAKLYPFIRSQKPKGQKPRASNDPDAKKSWRLFMRDFNPAVRKRKVM